MRFMRFQLTTARYRFAAALYLFLVYAFGVFSRNAWSDDFSTILNPSEHRIHAIRDGRIIYGWLLDFLFSYFNTIQALSFIKLIGLLGLVLLNDSLIRKLSSSASAKNVAVATTLAFTLPSFQFAAHWAVLFMMGWTAYLAVIGLQFFSRHSFTYKLIGIILFSTSLLLYPLMSFFIFSYIYCLWLLDGASASKLCIELRQGVILVLSASAASYFFALEYLKLNDLAFNPRVALLSVDDIPGKVFFFFSRPFAMTYRPFLINSPTANETIFSVFLFSFLLILIFWHKSRSIRGMSIHILMFNIVIVLSVLPLLVISDNQIDMRFIASNTWLYVFIFSYLFFDQISKIQFGSLLVRRFISSGIVVLLLTFGATTINFHFLVLYQNRFQEKESFFGLQISKCSRADLSHGITIIARTIPWPKSSYIGAYSQHTDLESSWVPIASVVEYLKDHNLPSANLPVISNSVQNEDECEIRLNEYPK